MRILSIVFMLTLSACSSLNKGDMLQRELSSKEIKCSPYPHMCHVLGLAKLKQKRMMEAKALFEKACSMNFSDSCFHLGVMAYHKKDMPQTYSYFQKACDKGHEKSCTNLGTLRHRQGNVALAKGIFNSSCQRGFAPACSRLAYLKYKQGHIKEALLLSEKACVVEDGASKDCQARALIIEDLIRKGHNLDALTDLGQSKVGFGLKLLKDHIGIGFLR